MAEKIIFSIDDGSLEYEIRNKRDELIGAFRINPADPDIALRAEKAVDNFNQLSFTEPASNDEALDIIRDFTSEVHTLFNAFLGYNAAPELFSGCSALSVVPDGDFYFEKVMAYIVKTVDKVANSRVNKKLAKIRKATAKYRG